MLQKFATKIYYKIIVAYSISKVVCGKFACHWEMVILLLPLLDGDLVI